MLEANIYDNFNPNELNILDFELPGGAGKVARPLPRPKARTQVLDYELWQTGYKFTSSATFATDVEVGDIVEVLTTESVPVAMTADVVEDFPLALIYLVIDVDENNKATLKNYFWAMIDGMSIPTQFLKGTTGSLLIKMIDPAVNSLMTYGFMYNPDVFKQQIKYNRKSDSTEMTGVAKDLFRIARFQPFPTIRMATYDPDGEVLRPRNTIEIFFAGRRWERKHIYTRIDDTLNPVTEYETLVERSNYNFATVYVKTDPEGTSYDPNAKHYTLDDAGNVVDMSTYTGDGYNLPAQRINKTLFYDEAPTIAQIRSEISPDTVVANIYFNQDSKRPLYVNDLVPAYINGVYYNGHIADRCFTPKNERLLFVENK